MAINKVIYGGSTIIDITDADVSVGDVADGVSFYTKDGIKRTGSLNRVMNVSVGSASVTDETLVISSGGGSATLVTKTITSNGTYNASNDSADGYSQVTVNVQPSLQNKTVTSNGSVTADSGYDGLGTVTVNVQPTLQSKTNITPTTSSQTIQADSGYDGLSSVQIDAIPSSYIVPSGSQTLTTNDTYDVTSLASVTVDVQSEEPTVATASATPSSNSTTISFSVQGEPKMFAIQINKNASYISGSSSRYITSVMSDGTTVYTTCLYKSGSTSREYNYSTSSFTYSNGTLTITSAGSSSAGYFMSGTSYRLIYIY